MTIYHRDSTFLSGATRDTLAHVADALQSEGHITVTVWSGNRDGDEFRVTVDLYYQREREGRMQVTRIGITHALIDAGVLDRAKGTAFHGTRHMGLFRGGGTPVAANTVLLLERCLGLEPYSIQNWSEA